MSPLNLSDSANHHLRLSHYLSPLPPGSDAVVDRGHLRTDGVPDGHHGRRVFLRCQQHLHRHGALTFYNLLQHSTTFQNILQHSKTIYLFRRILYYFLTFYNLSKCSTTFNETLQPSTNSYNIPQTSKHFTVSQTFHIVTNISHCHKHFTLSQTFHNI